MSLTGQGSTSSAAKKTTAGRVSATAKPTTYVAPKPAALPKALSRDRAPAVAPYTSPASRAKVEELPPTPSQTVVVNEPAKSSAQYAQELYGDASLGAALTKWFQSRGQSGQFKMGTEVGVPSKADLQAFAAPAGGGYISSTGSTISQGNAWQSGMATVTQTIQNVGNFLATGTAPAGTIANQLGVPAPGTKASAGRRGAASRPYSASAPAPAPLNSMNQFEQMDIERRANIRSAFGGQEYVKSTPFSVVPQEQAQLTDVQRQTELAIKGGQVTGRDAQGNVTYQGNQQFTPQAPNKMSDSYRQFAGYSDQDLVNSGYLYDPNTGWWYLPESGVPGAPGGGAAGGGGGGGGGGPFSGSSGSYYGGAGGGLVNWRIGL